MKEDNVEPNVVTFNTLITFFAKSKERKVLERADSLLQYMEKSERADLRPDHRQYMPVIKGWLSFGDSNNASRVLIRQVQQYIDTQRPGTAPNAIIMNMVMQGWIKVGDLDRATSLIAKMQELKDADLLPEGPNSRTYENLHDAWRRSTHPAKSANMQKLRDRLAQL